MTKGGFQTYSTSRKESWPYSFRHELKYKQQEKSLKLEQTNNSRHMCPQEQGSCLEKPMRRMQMQPAHFYLYHQIHHLMNQLSEINQKSK